MKKLSLLFSVFILLTAFTCENEPLEGEFYTGPNMSCEEAILNSASASLSFVSATEQNYTELCNALKNALEIQIDVCGDEDGTLQATIDGLGNCIDDANELTDIVGTWLMTAWMGEEPIDLNNDGVENLNFLDEMDCYNNETLVFNANNTVVATSNAYADFEFSIVAGTTNTYEYTITCINEVDITNGTWTQNGNTVSILEGAESSIWTLNGNQLSILVPSGFIAYSSEDSEVTTIQDITFIYTKQ